MGAIAIITTFLVFLLGIGLFGLIIGTIFLISAVLKKKSKLFVTLPNVSIILFLIPFVISIICISYIRYMIKDKPKIDTGTKIYWKYENNNEYEQYFIYNDKKYVLLSSYYKYTPKNREIDKPVANIIESEEGILSRLFMSIFGIKEKENLLYTIKGYHDDSLLIEDRLGFLFCEENKFSEKNSYYKNIDNYKYYATYGRLPEETESIELYNEDIIKEIYKYSGSGVLLQCPPEEECNYIFIFGISNDGILIKYLASIIIYNNQIYKEFGFFTENEAAGMAVLDKRQSDYLSDYINKIILDNGWKENAEIQKRMQSVL